MTAPSRPRPPLRGRRTARTTGDDREAAILATAERLLADRALADVSVDDLARGAGISRPTFYFYFRSKDAVLLALLDRVVAEADRASEDAFARTAADPQDRWRGVIDAYRTTFSRHRPVTLASAQLRSSNAEVRDAWARVAEGWVAACAAGIEAERRRGTAPPGAPARDLAVALTSLNERVLYGSFSGEGPAIAEDDVLEVLLTVWLSTIYRPVADAGPT